MAGRLEGRLFVQQFGRRVLVAGPGHGDHVVAHSGHGAAKVTARARPSSSSDCEDCGSNRSAARRWSVAMAHLAGQHAALRPRRGRTNSSIQSVASLSNAKFGGNTDLVQAAQLGDLLYVTLGGQVVALDTQRPSATTPTRSGNRTSRPISEQHRSTPRRCGRSIIRGLNGAAFLVRRSGSRRSGPRRPPASCSRPAAIALRRPA